MFVQYYCLLLTIFLIIPTFSNPLRRTDVLSSSSSTSSRTVQTSRTVTSSGQVQNGTSSRSYSASSSRSRRVQASGTGRQQYQRTNCYYCLAAGRQFPPGRRFQFDDNCWRFDCDCNCDGSYRCPASRTKDICGDQCRNCRRSGVEYPPNTVFEFDDGCFRYNCDCSCDGSYNCPAGRTKDICGNRPSQCRECVVSGRKYQPNTQFQFDERCSRYTCDCNCDGSWECPSERTIDICRQPDRQQCKQCLAGGARRQPNSQFQYDEGCYRYTCDCKCDGSWNCPAQKTIDICRRALQAPQPVSKCERCKVGDESFAGNSSFSYTDDCLEYHCDCNCDGSFSCPKSKIERVCNSGQQCKSCIVKGESYRSNARFSFIEGCDQMQCMCNCDGTWYCPPSSTRNVCDDSSRDCKQCHVRGTDYPGNSFFVMQEDCYQYNCRCNCDGSWKCPSENTVNICDEPFVDRGDLG